MVTITIQHSKDNTIHTNNRPRSSNMHTNNSNKVGLSSNNIRTNSRDSHSNNSSIHSSIIIEISNNKLTEEGVSKIKFSKGSTLGSISRVSQATPSIGKEGSNNSNTNSLCPLNNNSRSNKHASNNRRAVPISITFERSS